MTEPTEPADFVPDAANSRAFRDALGAFATGVTVVTAPGAQGPLGITANSFASVSLDPPLVLWSPARASRRFDDLVAAPHFAVHVLAAAQRDLAAHFSRHAQGFDLPGVAFSAQGVPVLPGCLAVFECAREAVHQGGDHAIVVGRVLAVRHRKGAPLVFHGGHFGGFHD
ncbi:MAG: flavin reductase family protein [Rhodobacter sp.]|uniref:flavin reductase family protein n=1 Tax=Pararhodobacter sp. TaxID=2127056 RepID=UPI001E0F8D41|nr:flavin reductase family protein [Pararhodobacter sp.]MCB1345564.1 flavin reductase family protein [Paracoccaceae bacterium]MCC0074530.1 flavin reductase family protein [Rhodobacter sp.]HPD91750.1 flavin reductase family protein [Pararhodobacter sp.]